MTTVNLPPPQKKIMSVKREIFHCIFLDKCFSANLKCQKVNISIPFFPGGKQRSLVVVLHLEVVDICTSSNQLIHLIVFYTS